MQEAVDLYNMLSDSDTNLRQPIGMANQLLQEGMDSDVARSMLQLLQVSLHLVLCTALSSRLWSLPVAR